MKPAEQKEWVKQLKLLFGVSALLTSYSVGGVVIGELATLYFGLPKILSIFTGMTGLVLGIIKITQWVKKINEPFK